MNRAPFQIAATDLYLYKYHKLILILIALKKNVRQDTFDETKHSCYSQKLNEEGLMVKISVFIVIDIDQVKFN